MNGNNRLNSEGFPEDPTRLPEFYDGTYAYFKSLGIKVDCVRRDQGAVIQLKPIGALIVLRSCIHGIIPPIALTVFPEQSAAIFHGGSVIRPIGIEV